MPIFNIGDFVLPNDPIALGRMKRYWPKWDGSPLQVWGKDLNNGIDEATIQISWGGDKRQGSSYMRRFKFAGPEPTKEERLIKKAKQLWDRQSYVKDQHALS